MLPSYDLEPTPVTALCVNLPIQTVTKALSSILDIPFIAFIHYHCFWYYEIRTASTVSIRLGATPFAQFCSSCSMV